VTPGTEAGRKFLEILMVQARHVSLAEQLTEDFPTRILAIEAEARVALLGEVREKVAFLDRKSDAGPGFIGGYGQALADLSALLDTLSDGGPTVVDTGKACSLDPLCYRFQGHKGEHMHPIPDGGPTDG
jgi:hypothetical protein